MSKVDELKTKNENLFQKNTILFNENERLKKEVASALAYQRTVGADNRIEELENKIADTKANCDLAIEGRDIKIKELEKENENLKGDLELWESGGCRATNLFKCGVVKELKDQLTKAKEIIKDLLRLPYANDWEVYGDVTSHLDKAEQFLKEIEK